MDSIVYLHSLTKTASVFKKHFLNDGQLSKSLIAAIIRGENVDESIIYDGANNVYLDCSDVVLDEILYFLRQPDYEHFLAYTQNENGDEYDESNGEESGYNELEQHSNEVGNSVGSSSDQINRLEASSPILVIDELVDNLHTRLIEGTESVEKIVAIKPNIKNKPKAKYININ